MSGGSRFLQETGYTDTGKEKLGQRDETKYIERSPKKQVNEWVKLGPRRLFLPLTPSQLHFLPLTPSFHHTYAQRVQNVHVNFYVCMTMGCVFSYSLSIY